MPCEDRAKDAQCTSTELREAVEKDLDANYLSVGIPHPNRTVATWYLLTVLEDSVRMLFTLTELARKLRWLQTRIRSALDALDISSVDEAEWRIEGVVVIKTFGGTRSDNSRIPILTERIFIQGMQGTPSLLQFATWSQSLRWLPLEGEHFRVVPQEVHLNALGKTLTAFGIEKLCSLQSYNEFVEKSLAASQL